MDSRGKKNKKFNFCEKRDCAIKSIKEVNCFVCKLKKAGTIKRIFRNKKEKIKYLKLI